MTPYDRKRPTSLVDAGRRKHPQEPWKWRAEWTLPEGIPPRDTGSRHSLLRVVWIVCVVLAALNALKFLGGLIFALLERTHPLEALVVNLASLFGALVFGTASVLLRRHGATSSVRTNTLYRARFVPADLPIPLGGALSGRIDVPAEFRITGEGRVSVFCLRRRRYIYNDENGHDREREESAQVGVTNSRILPVAGWQTAGRGQQAYFTVPLPAGPPSEPDEPTLETPSHEWQLHVELATARGDVALTFLVPVFRVAAADPADDSAHAGAAVLPPPLPPAEPPRIADLAAQIAVPSEPVARDRYERLSIFAAGNLRLVDQPGAAGGEAVRFDPAAASQVVGLRILGILVLNFLFGCGIVVLLLLPLVGYYLALAAALFALYFNLCGAREIGRTLRGPAGIWAEPDAVCLQGKDGRIERIPRADVARFEITTLGGSSLAQYYRIILAGPPSPDSAVRPRRPLAEAVRSREAAQAVAHWLAAGLSAPAPGVIIAEPGLALLERLAGKRR